MSASFEIDHVELQLLAHTAPELSCVGSGHARSIACKIAVGTCRPGSAVLEHVRSTLTDGNNEAVGRVYSLGTWSDTAARAQLASFLGKPLASALRTNFEWYRCRGAFFHNDAHYDARMFGVWSITGPAADLVFPRASVRAPCSPGSIAVFDPFEVHGVLSPTAQTFAADDYAGVAPTVLLGFEIDLTPAVADVFGIRPSSTGRFISSSTRIAASNGVLDLD